MEVIEHFNEETNEYEYPTVKRLKWRYSLFITKSFNVEIDDYLCNEDLIKITKEIFKKKLMGLINEKYDLSKRVTIPVIKSS